jgi:hypothetical protein
VVEICAAPAVRDAATDSWPAVSSTSAPPSAPAFSKMISSMISSSLASSSSPEIARVAFAIAVTSSTSAAVVVVTVLVSWNGALARISLGYARSMSSTLRCAPSHRYTLRARAR